MREKAKKSNDSLVAGFSGLRQKIKEKRQEKRSKNEERQEKGTFLPFSRKRHLRSHQIGRRYPVYTNALRKE